MKILITFIIYLVRNAMELMQMTAHNATGPNIDN